MNFMFKVEKFLDILINKGGYKEVLTGLQNTMIIAVMGLLIGIVIGTLIATIRVMPKYKKAVRAMDKFCSFYVGLFRGTPMVVQLLVFYYVMLPLMGIKMSSVLVAITVFGLNSGAYISEIMRGGILSVDPGQMEGGRSVGLSYGTTMLKIVIPQAVKNILPTLGNEFISLIKETSVLSFIAVYDLYKALLDVGMVKYDSMVPYIMMGLIYIVLVLIITAGIKLLERRFAKSDRN